MTGMCGTRLGLEPVPLATTSYLCCEPAYF